MTERRKVHVLINPASGILPSLNPLIHALYRHWEMPKTELTIQFSSSMEDGREKARKAIASGTEIMLVAGGDYLETWKFIESNIFGLKKAAT